MGAITLITAVFGVMLGSASLAIGVMSFLRDRSRLEVYHDIRQDEQSRIKLAVLVINVGRRPALIRNVGFSAPYHQTLNGLHLSGAVPMDRLALREGDPPLIITLEFDPALLEPLREAWPSIRAYAEDSNGRWHYSQAFGQTWGNLKWDGAGRATGA